MINIHSMTCIVNQFTTDLPTSSHMAGNCCSVAPLSVRGYDAVFVESIPDSLCCLICFLPFRDPHLLDCCGRKYCAPCIGRIQAAGEPCPLCKQQQFNTMLDKGTARQVMDLKTRCSRNGDGCEWKGELRHLEHHERDECGWTVVQCSYQCGVRTPRHQLAEHEQDVCPLRPVSVKLDSLLIRMETERKIDKEFHEKEMQKMEARHSEEMGAVREEFGREMESKEKSHAAEVVFLKRKLAEQEKKIDVSVV